MFMFYIAGISISFFLSLILFSKKEHLLADRILAVWLIVVGIHLFFFYAGITGLIFEIPALLGLHLPLPLFHGPFLFIYAAAQTGRLTKWNIKHGLHFIPALVNYVYLIHYFILPPEAKALVYKNQGAGYEVYLLINSLAIWTSGIGYIIATTLLLRRHRKHILHTFSATEKINLQWIQYLIYGISIIWVFVILDQDNLVFGSAVLFVLFIGYFGIRQVGIFNLNPTYTADENLEIELPVSGTETLMEISENPGIAPEVLRKKYEKSGLDEGTATQLHQRLKQLMVSEKPFTQSELTLTDLSKQLSVHPNHLSQVINEKEGLNFYDYINTLRVEEFKSRLNASDHLKFTLLALAYECGFNSKSTFNKYFRKVTGYTPTQYLKQLEQRV